MDFFPFILFSFSSGVWFVNIFSSLHLSFHLLTEFFREQTFFFKFWWSTVYQFFLLWVIRLVSSVRTLCLALDHEDFSLMFFSWSFTVLHLSQLSIWVNFYIRCETLDKFPFFAMYVQLLQHHLLRRLFFFCWIAFASLSNISWSYLYRSISGFSLLSHWNMFPPLC